MSSKDIQIRLEQLHELLLRERECAKKMDLEGMHSLADEKKALLQTLESVENEGPEHAALAEKIRMENRRNAFLFWSTLKYIRESMAFFNRQVSRPAYGAGGRMQQGCNSGLVLKGRV